MDQLEDYEAVSVSLVMRPLSGGARFSSESHSAARGVLH